MDTKLKNAIKTLCAALEEDKSEGSYYYSWQANIAMAFMDETDRRQMNFGKGLDWKEKLHEAANQAAKNFLDNLCRK